MFGGNHRPNVKDIKPGGNAAKDDGFFEEEYEVTHDDEEPYEAYTYMRSINGAIRGKPMRLMSMKKNTPRLKKLTASVVPGNTPFLLSRPPWKLGAQNKMFQMETCRS